MYSLISVTSSIIDRNYILTRLNLLKKHSVIQVVARKDLHFSKAAVILGKKRTATI